MVPVDLPLPCFFLPLTVSSLLPASFALLPLFSFVPLQPLLFSASLPVLFVFSGPPVPF